MGKGRKWTIGIRPAVGQRIRKITKIIGLNGDGFSVLAPYHKARSGHLSKMPVDPSKAGVYAVAESDMVNYTAEDRVKLSYHTDGFAQFSGETSGRITSGRDPITGQPKGLGLFTHPLKSPVWSGPSVGVTIWGIDDFEEASERDDVLAFEPSEFYYRGCTPDDANGWMLSIYAFPIGVMPPVRFDQGRALIEVALEPLSGQLVSIVQLRVIHLPEEEVFLGLFVNRMMTSFSPQSGWILNGPGDFTRDQKGHVLMGMYPRGSTPVGSRGSLDRTPPADRKEEPSR
jgi:hypothetical protein